MTEKEIRKEVTIEMGGEKVDWRYIRLFASLSAATYSWLTVSKGDGQPQS